MVLSMLIRSNKREVFIHAKRVENLRKTFHVLIFDAKGEHFFSVLWVKDTIILSLPVNRIQILCKNLKNRYKKSQRVDLHSMRVMDGSHRNKKQWH